MMKLVDAAVIESCDTIIEVGTGTASLTRLLAARAGAVHTFEIDETIADIAAGELAGLSNVTLHRGDALQSKTVLSPELTDVLEHSKGPVKLVANLPYDVATPLVVELLLVERAPESMSFTIQREVGERLAAPLGSRDYGPVSVVCQRYATIERLAVLAPSVFWPQPKVDSVMLRVTARGDLPDVSERQHFTNVVRGAFLHRRKTIKHILRSWMAADAVESTIAAAQIDGNSRPESLSPADWERIAQRIPPESRGGRRAPLSGRG